MTDIFIHMLIGMVGAITGYGVRTACKHRGLLPHPVAHISLTLALLFIESAALVAVVG